MTKFSLTLTALLLASGSVLAQQATDAIDPEGPTVAPAELPEGDALSTAIADAVADDAEEEDAEAEAEAQAEAEIAAGVEEEAPETEAPAPGDPWAGLTEAGRAGLAAKDENRVVSADNWMVAAAHPLAVEAGAKVLEAGGSAADAMIAVQVVLGLVEPQSSGLGGGAFLVWYDAESGEMTTLDARETAPMLATPKLFLNDDGTPMGFWDGVVGGLSVGTPGTPALLEEAHRRWGRANWAGLFTDGIRLAEEGFAVSPRLASAIASDLDRLGTFAETADYFMPGGTPLAAGASLQNPAYAEVLRAMAEGGADAFYTGPIAAGIVRAVNDAQNPGVLSMDDLAMYRVIEREPVCVEYRDHEVCGMGPV